ncbi:MAG: ABC transporter ATP-binding protein [Bacilli bacterium]|jgi:ABC-type multidrug transport system fused ATPase/permease subunit|nr:ABC transporter ATP-binding protein [Bacilli bacterium]
MSKKDKKEDGKEKIKFSSLFKYLKYSYKYAKQEKKYLFLVLIANIILTIISIAVPIFGAKQIVSLTGGEWNRLIVVIITIFVLEISRNLGRLIYMLSWNKYFYSVKKNIQLDLAEEMLKITQDDLNMNSSGVFIERLNNDTEKLTDIFIDLLDWISDIVGGLGVFIGIFFINKIIFGIYLFFIVVLFFFQKRAQDILMKKRKIHIKNREKVNGFTSEIIRGAKDIKILNAEKSFLIHASSIMDILKKSGNDLNGTRAKLNFLNGDVRDLLDLLISLFGVYFIINGNLSVSAMLIIYNYSPKIMNLSSHFERLIECINEFNLSASRIFGVLVEEEFHKESFGTMSVKKLNGNIVFDKVSFSYDDEQSVLKNMSFEVEANKTVAFVGKSGAGKTTIFNLISKLYDADSGEIILDKYNIKDLDRDSIRGNLSIISQNPYIYNMSIRENLQIIKTDATEKDIKKACKMACLHDFVMTLKDGYDTIVGEGGVTLSGGQKQRLAIARAFLLKTKIILFDEATSALDNETQKEITKAIENMKGDYTVLIIAHRLSTVQNADKIFVIDNGKVVDSGTRNYLLKNCKVFKKLYETELEDEN